MDLLLILLLISNFQETFTTFGFTPPTPSPTLQIRCVKLCKVVYYMNHTTGLCGSYSTQLYTTFTQLYTTDLQCTVVSRTAPNHSKTGTLFLLLLLLLLLLPPTCATKNVLLKYISTFVREIMLCPFPN